MNNKLNGNNDSIFVKCFPGATTKCMEDYIKPSLSKRPDHIIIHCGTNDLSSNKSAESISSGIIKLATSVEHSRVSVSALTCRRDEWAQKANEVNRCLKEMCGDRNIGFIPNENIKTSHLNRSHLHLNKTGTKLLEKNFFQFINKK